MKHLGLFFIFILLNSCIAIKTYKAEKDYGYAALYRLARDKVAELNQKESVIIVGNEKQVIGHWPKKWKLSLVSLDFKCLNDITMETIEEGSETLEFNERLLRIDDEFIENCFNTCRTKYYEWEKYRPTKDADDIMSIVCCVLVISFCLFCVFQCKKRKRNKEKDQEKEKEKEEKKIK